jgi:alkanesulfonate monooxygenase SsuD/methylene tetrahydromethanopterin reductase-like flavin-dependent oxidoreductase (luciferase family)
MDGEFIKLAGARLAFKPNAIPIYIAAMGPDMLQLAGRIADGVALSAGLSTDSVRQSLALCDQGAAKAGRDLKELRRAGYIFFGTSNDARAAIDLVRSKLAFVMRNKFLAQNIKDSGIPVDHEAVIAAIARRDLKAAAALVPDEAVEAFGIAGSPDHCMRRLRDFIDAGLDEPVLSLVGSPENCAFAIDVMGQFTAKGT